MVHTRTLNLTLHKTQAFRRFDEEYCKTEAAFDGCSSGRGQKHRSTHGVGAYDSPVPACRGFSDPQDPLATGLSRPMLTCLGQTKTSNSCQIFIGAVDDLVVLL